MKVIGINASPRKGWNSDLALDHALKGAAEAGAEVKKYDLFDLKFTGCLSCFGCKRLDGPSYTRCALRDDLTPVLAEILEADAVIFSAPIYYGDVPGALRNLYERLLFPPNLYSADGSIGYTKKVKVGLIYTMGAKTPEFNGSRGEADSRAFKIFLGPTEVLNIVNTYQFDDYSKYASSKFDVADKIRSREEDFPEDCKRAYELGARLAAE